MSLLQVAVKSQAMALVAVVALSLLSFGAQSPDRGDDRITMAGTGGNGAWIHAATLCRTGRVDAGIRSHGRYESLAGAVRRRGVGRSLFVGGLSSVFPQRVLKSPLHPRRLSRARHRESTASRLTQAPPPASPVTPHDPPIDPPARSHGPHVPLRQPRRSHRASAHQAPP